MSNIITLLTDFGLQDHYCGAMRGRILQRNPRAVVVDITHYVPPQNLHAGAWLLAAILHDFPAGTVHCAVVDPGVGSKRKAMVLQTPNHLWVGPDNGLFTLIMRQAGDWQAREIASRNLVSPRMSTTFHGRDIFAPVAGSLSAGFPFEQIGPVIESPVMLDIPQPLVHAGSIEGHIIYVDHFGNLISNIHREDISTAHMFRLQLQAQAGGHTITRYYDTYEEGGTEPFLIFGSGDYLELSVANGSAAEQLGVSAGQHLILTQRSD